MENEMVQQFMALKTKEFFGNSFILNRLTRILGGAQKHTYLAEAENGFHFIIYIWDKSTSYFTYSEKEDVFYSSSAQLFELNNNLMIQHSVLTPKLYYMDRSKREKNYEYAFAEYIDGIDMEGIMSQHSEHLPKALDSLKSSIANLHSIKSGYAGQLNHMQTAEFDIIRFGNLFEYLEKELDPKRMEFYHICHCLGNLSGATQLKLKGYYDMDGVNGMIEYFNDLLSKVRT